MDENLTTDQRIQAEQARISALFEDVDNNQRAIAAPLIQNAAFMRITLEDLQEIIKADGATEIYRHGADQYGMKPSATFQTYNALIKDYTSVIKALSKMLPPGRRQQILTPVQPMRMKTDEERKAEMQEAQERAKRIRDEVLQAAERQRQQREKEKDPGLFSNFGQV